MPVPFVASLRTTRALERGVSYHGGTQESVEKPARAWLEAFGEHGDSFEVVENVPTLRATLACARPPAEKPVRKLKGHEFMAAARGLRCDVCGNLEEGHT